MAHLNTIRDFFAAAGPRTAQEWIRLQIFPRQAAPEPDDDCDGALASVPWLKKRDVRFKLLYQCARSFKAWARSWDTQFPGWRSGIAGFSILATLVLVANLSALIWAATHLDDGSYFATMTVQSCRAVDRTSAYIHLAMNVLSVALLAGSNYCMQCLSSPTRTEVDAAHAKGSYLNIGILSLRNIFSFRKRRACLLLALVLSSVPLHAVYASSVTMTRSVLAYDVVGVSTEFFDGANFTVHRRRSVGYYLPQSRLPNLEHRLRILQNLTTNGQIWNETRWTNLSVAECREYGTLDTDRGSVLLVKEDQYKRRTIGKAHNLELYRDGVLEVDPPSTVGRYYSFPEFLFSMRTDSYSWYDISYCLSLVVPSRCSLQIHLWLLLTVVVCNTIKLACFILTLEEQHGTPLVTVVDAVGSFLSSPHPSVEGMCLLSEDALIGALKYDTEDPGPRPVQYQATSLRYYQSISFMRWTIYSTSCALLILVSSYWWNEIRVKYLGDRLDYSFRAMWRMGFGKLRADSSGWMLPSCYLRPDSYTVGCERPLGFGGVFIAAVPQLAVSAIYIAMNHQITVMVQLRDWTRLALHSQPLRVSDPTPSSAQVSTYWLSLPLLYSLPLLASSILLGWLASQALFYCRIVFHVHVGPYGESSSIAYPPIGWGKTYHGLGYSGMGVTFSISIGFCVFLSSLAMGIQKCVAGPPLGPTCSLVIAAACHPPDNDRNAATKLVQWGEVKSDNNAEERDPVRHCTITSWKVKPPRAGLWYA